MGNGEPCTVRREHDILVHQLNKYGLLNERKLKEWRCYCWVTLAQRRHVMVMLAQGSSRAGSTSAKELAGGEAEKPQTRQGGGDRALGSGRATQQALGSRRGAMGASAHAERIRSGM